MYQQQSAVRRDTERACSCIITTITMEPAECWPRPYRLYVAGETSESCDTCEPAELGDTGAAEDEAGLPTAAFLRRGKQDAASHRVIEKRRRDRMNGCLAELARLLPAHSMRRGRGRLEKTEIVETAIRHLRSLAAPPSGLVSEPYRAGYLAAAGEAARFVSAEGGPGPARRLAAHLRRWGRSPEREPATGTYKFKNSISRRFSRQQPVSAPAPATPRELTPAPADGPTLVPVFALHADGVRYVASSVWASCLPPPPRASSPPHPASRSHPVSLLVQFPACPRCPPAPPHPHPPPPWLQDRCAISENASCE